MPPLSAIKTPSPRTAASWFARNVAPCGAVRPPWHRNQAGCASAPVEALSGARPGMVVAQLGKAIYRVNSACAASATPFKPKPGWLFLTDDGDDVDRLRRALGWDPDPKSDADKTRHGGIVMMGNEPLVAGSDGRVWPRRARFGHVLSCLNWPKGWRDASRGAGGNRHAIGPARLSPWHCARHLFVVHRADPRRPAVYELAVALTRNSPTGFSGTTAIARTVG